MAAERMLVAAPLGNRIVAAAAPGMAACKTPQCQPHAGKRTMSLDRLDSVVRAARQIAAGRTEHRRDDELVTADQTAQQKRQHNTLLTRADRRARFPTGAAPSRDPRSAPHRAASA